MRSMTTFNLFHWRLWPGKLARNSGEQAQRRRGGIVSFCILIEIVQLHAGHSLRVGHDGTVNRRHIPEVEFISINSYAERSFFIRTTEVEDLVRRTIARAVLPIAGLEEVRSTIAVGF